MSKEFKTFNSILYGNLNPDKIYAIPDDKLRSKINHIEIVKPKYEFIIYLKLSKPINHKLRYYALLIDNTKIKYLNNAINTIKNSINTNTRYYNLCNYLENEIESLIQDCFNELNSVEKSFDDDLVLSMAQNLSSQFSTKDSPNLKDKHFIYEYLFYSLIHIHLEIQGHFYNNLNDHKTLDDFKFNYAFEHTPIIEPIFYKEEIVHSIDSQNDKEEVKIEEETDISKTFTYVKLDRNPEAIRLFYESLKNQGFINEEDANTSYKNFKCFFDGSAIVNTQPIKWRKDASSFAYLIWLLHNKLKLVEDLKQKQWKVAFELFLNSKGKKFPYTTRKSIKSATYEPMIKKAVNCLKN